MVDYIKIIINDPILIKRIWKNKLLCFHSETKKRFGDEIRNIPSKEFRGLIFKMFDNRLEISGSLHKYFNSGIHNANDFKIVDCIQVVEELRILFKLELDQCKLVNLEFGLNILPVFESKKLLDNLHYHERNEFRSLPDLEYAKQSAKFKSNGKINTYKIIKAYIKGLQSFKGRCYVDCNTFRFEIHSNQSKYFSQFGVRSLADLIRPEVYYSMGEALINEWNRVLITEREIEATDLRIEKYLNRDFWARIREGHRNQFSRHKKVYLDLVNHYPGSMYLQVNNLIETKLNSFFKEIGNDANSTLAIKNCDANSTTNQNELVADSTIVYKESAPKKYCAVTGIDISMQNERSKYLSPVGLKWYKANQPDLYTMIRKGFLPRSGISGKHTKYESDEYSHIAKQIRSCDYNPSRFKAKVGTGQYKLY